MNNKIPNENRKLVDEQRNTSTSNYNQFINPLRDNLEKTTSESRGLRKQIQDKYSSPDNFMTPGLKANANGWFDTSSMPGMGGPSSAAFDPNGDFAKARTGYEKFADTGGRENFADSEASYKNFINNGGVDATALRNRATAQIPAFYDAFKRSAQRRNNVQGGYSPGFDAQQAEIGRQAGREGFNASRQVEGDIADKVQQGKMFGTTGMFNIGGAASEGKLRGLGGLENIGQAGQQNAQFNAGLGESANARNQALQLALQKMYQEGGFESGRGLSDLYRSAPGDVGQSLDAYLKGIGGLDSSTQNNLAMRNTIKNRSLWDLAPSIIGAAGGIATGGFGNVGRTAFKTGRIQRGQEDY